LALEFRSEHREDPKIATALRSTDHSSHPHLTFLTQCVKAGHDGQDDIEAPAIACAFKTYACPGGRGGIKLTCMAILLSSQKIDRQ